jgi:hypothetical protein
MTMTIRALFLAAVLSAAYYTVAFAQDDATRHGPWFNGALGYGSAKVSCDTCRSGSHLDGWEGLLQVGGTPSPHLRLGAGWEFFTHWLPDGETVRALVTVSGSMYYYPRVTGGPFIEGELGLCDYRMLKGVHDGVLFLTGDTTYAQGRGGGATTGVGYHFRVGRELLVAPRVAYTHGDIGTLHSGLLRVPPFHAPVARGWKQNVVSVVFNVEMAQSPD